MSNSANWVGGRDMRKSRFAILSPLLAVGAFSRPLLANTATAVAASPLTTPPIGTQLAELKGSDTVPGDYLGSSVATTVLIGRYGHANKAGRAYVFNKTAAGRRQAAQLKGSDTVADFWFGHSVAISGTTVVVGAFDHAKDAGRAYVFEG